MFNNNNDNNNINKIDEYLFIINVNIVDNMPDVVLDDVVDNDDE